MAFADLTWTAGFWNEEAQANMGFESQWYGSNGYLLRVRTKVHGTDHPVPATATEAGQLYDCEVYSWDRTENSEAVSSEYGVDATRVEAIMGEVDAIALPEVEETTTTTTIAPGPPPQWD